MFKLKSFSVNSAAVTEGNKNTRLAINNRVKLINAFTHKIFWEDKDKVMHKYLVSTEVNNAIGTANNNQTPVAMFTYSDFEYKLRTLVGDHNCFNLFNFEILGYPISKFFVYEFSSTWDNPSFGNIGKCDILEFEDWMEIFLSTANAIKKYNQDIGNARKIFMRHNRLAPKVWKHLRDSTNDRPYLRNDSYRHPDDCSYKKYFDEYIQNPCVDCTDIVIYFKDRPDGIENLDMFSLNWDSIPGNTSIGKEFFTKNRHNFRDGEGSFIEDSDYWDQMSESSNIDTDGFLEYISGLDLTDVMKSPIWYKALINLDLENEGVTAYIEANPLTLTFDHVNNPTMTIKWMKHIVHNFMKAADLRMGNSYLYRIIDSPCLLEEDLVMFINHLKENNLFEEYQYKDTISNPNISEQFIEKEIFGRFKEFDGYDLDDIYDDPRITSHFIEKYLLGEYKYMLKAVYNLTGISKNPNIKESHIQTIIDFIKTEIDNGPYPSCTMYLDWVSIIANPNISIEFLIENIHHINRD